MASKSEATASRIIVIDTCCLLDLYGIPGSSSQSKKVDQKAQNKITELFEGAIRNNDRLFVPWPCIFEVGNHIANAGQTDQSRLAQQFLEEIKTSVEKQVPWIITPTEDIKFLPKLFETFATDYVGKNTKKGEKRGSIGLTDAFTIDEVKRLKEKYRDRQVLIWTVDNKLLQKCQALRLTEHSKPLY